MLQLKKNEQGFAIVYSLAVLLIATVGGTALLFISRKDRTEVSDYAKMRITAEAAESALRAVEGRFSNNPQVAFDILNAFTTNNNCKWILNSSAATASTEQKFKLFNEASSPQYSARIVGFDRNTSLAVIEGIGYYPNGGKKRAIALYRLDGIEMVTAPGPTNALYASGGFGNLDIPLIINGNVYAGGVNMFNGNSALGVTVNGNFKTGTGQFETNQKLTINGKAFFRGNARFQNYSSSISGKAGFKGMLELIGGINLSITNNAFLEGGNNGAAGTVNVSGGAYKAKYYNFPSTKINVTAPATKEASGSMAATMGDLLKMTDSNDGAPTIINNLENYITSKGGTIYTPSTAGLNFDTPGWNLSNAYSTKTKWNGFLVIKVSSSPNINADGTTFNGKIIWIIEAPISSNRWYASGHNSNSLIYLKGNAYFNNFAENLPGNLIRGVIYNASTTTNQTTYKIKAGTTIEGALIHNATAKPQFNFTSSTTVCTINYNKDVIQEFVDLGIMTLPTSGVAPVLTLVDTKIRPVRLSMQM